MTHTGREQEGRDSIVARMAHTNRLAYAAAVERPSEHPLAAAIVAAAEGEGIAIPKVSGFRVMVGRGVAGRVDGHDVAVGNGRLMEDERIETRWYKKKELDKLIRDGEIEDGKTLIAFLLWRRYK